MIYKFEKGASQQRDTIMAIKCTWVIHVFNIFSWRFRLVKISRNERFRSNALDERNQRRSSMSLRACTRQTWCKSGVTDPRRGP